MSWRVYTSFYFLFLDLCRIAIISFLNVRQNIAMIYHCQYLVCVLME